MTRYNKKTISEIKGVRISYDHIEQIIEWLKDAKFQIEISSLGIDKTYKNYGSINSLITLRGKKPKLVALTGKKEDTTIQILIYMQYCIIETINRDKGELEFKIIRLMKQSVPRLFKLFPFKWFVLLLLLMIITWLTAYFILDAKNTNSLIYSVYPIIAFIIAGVYNNKVNGINLIYSHEKASFWTRKKDDIILLILSTLVMVPIGSAIWEYFIKPLLENNK